MGRNGISQYDVHNAAEIIAAQGQLPTMQSIRNMLGSGSSSTIHKHLQSWKLAKMIGNESAHSTYIEYLIYQNTQLKKQLKQLQKHEPARIKLRTSSQRMFSRLMQRLPLIKRNHTYLD